MLRAYSSRRATRRHRTLDRPVNRTIDDTIGLRTRNLPAAAGKPASSSLRLHALAGKFEGLHSISINLSYRITIDFIIRERQIVPINIGDHETTHR
jgi:hypothetical protein